MRSANDPVGSIKVERPVEAKLVVRATATEEEWNATHDDLRKFGYRLSHDAYRAWSQFVQDALIEHGLEAGDLVKTKLNTIRYVFELASSIPEILDERTEEMDELRAEVAQIERILREHMPEES